MYKVYNIDKDFVTGTIDRKPTMIVDIHHNEDGTATLGKTRWNTIPIKLITFEKCESFNALVIGEDSIIKCSECSIELDENDDMVFKYKHAVLK